MKGGNRSKLQSGTIIKVVAALLGLVTAVWIATIAFQPIQLSHPNFPKCEDLTVVTELSTYNASKRDIKTKITEIAMQSWLYNTNHVIVLVEDDSICVDLTRKFPSIQCIKHFCNHQDFNIPTVPCLMMRGESLSTTKYILFTNGDITFSPIYPTLSAAVNALPNFVIAGQRIDVHTSRAVESAVNGVQELLNLALADGELHGESAIDYFLYAKTASYARKMPPFLIGNWKWDNWLLHDYIVSDQTTVIDATADLHAVHVGATSTALAQRRGAVYNARVFESSTFGIQGIGLGSLRYVDAVIRNGHITNSNDVTVQWTKFIFSLAKSSETLVVLTVPCGFLELLRNWVLWAQRSGLKSFVVFPMDHESLAFVKENNLPIVPLHHQLLPKTPTDCSKQEGRVAQELLVQRNYLLRNISQAGLGFVSMSVNTVLLEPLPFQALRNKEIFGQRRSDNTSSSEISSGFWGVPAANSRSAVKLLRSVIACQESAVNRSSDDVLHQDPCDDQIETHCLNNEIESSFAKSLSLLPDSFIANAQATFIQHRPQRRGSFPAVLHQDLYCDVTRSVDLLQKWHLMLERIPKIVPSVLPQQIGNISHAVVVYDSSKANSFSGIGEVLPELSLLIRIITTEDGSVKSLATLLSSLQKATFESDVVDIEIHLDAPLPGSDTQRYQGQQRLAQTFQWQQGQVKIVDSGVHKSHFDMYVQPFHPRIDGQLLLLLEDTNELSPNFYEWLKAALTHFRASDDPRLYGFALQRQHSVVGLKPEQRYGRNFLDLFVDPSRAFFRYQLVASFGTVFFPGHWNAFVNWSKEIRAKDVSFQPCIPFFYSNNWLTKRHPHIWMVWFNYYSFMHGLYSLYINYARHDEGGKRVSLVKSQKSNAALVNFLELPAPKMFLPSATYPLYDFHLNLVSNAQVLSDRWRLMSAVEDKCQSNHLDKRHQHTDRKRTKSLSREQVQ
jgi:hypothetical protein